MHQKKCKTKKLKGLILKPQKQVVLFPKLVDYCIALVYDMVVGFGRVRVAIYFLAPSDHSPSPLPGSNTMQKRGLHD